MKISDEVLVYAPEMNEKVARWGVYAIPRMWRAKGGELVIRFNGEADSADTNSMFCLPNLYFVSFNNGDTWELEPKGEEIYDISVLTGIDSPYLPLKNGETVFLKYKKDCLPIKKLKPKKTFIHPCGEALLASYCYGDIPSDCKGIYFGKIDKNGNEHLTEIDFKFDDREVLVNYKAQNGGEFVEVEQYIQPYIFKSPYLSSIKQLSNGDFVALSTGQNPNVMDKYCGEIYLVASIDGGKTWEKRATVASCISKLPYGYGGDGGEVSLAVAEDDSLYCVMRMDMSINPEEDKTKVWGTYFTSSFDCGYTWGEPKEISDSSVTPHIVSLKGALVVIYGRPGVHCKVSYDKGKTWSKSQSIIGKTLTEERENGRSDAFSKYFESCSYCNTFVEKISEDTVIVCYNDLNYLDKNGVKTKAAFVKKITIDEYN